MKNTSNKKIESVLVKITKEQAGYITLLTTFCNELLKEQIITPAQRNQISDYISIKIAPKK